METMKTREFLLRIKSLPVGQYCLTRYGKPWRWIIVKDKAPAPGPQVVMTKRRYDRMQVSQLERYLRAQHPEITTMEQRREFFDSLPDW